ncbi:unnamed protein product, partial [Closterium sp. Naga37s-1]
GVLAGCIITAILYLFAVLQQHVGQERRRPSVDVDARLRAIEEQVARMAAADVVGVVREEVGRVGGQVEAVQALQRASAQAGGDRGAALEARAREAEERAAQLNDTVGRLQAALRQHSATIAAMQAVEQAAAGAAGAEGGRALGRTVVEEDHPGRWRQHTFHRTGAYGFIQYSAYRVSAARIAVVGMGALGLRSKRRVEGCWWHRLDGHTVIAGKLTQMVMEEHHNYLYELVVLQCALEEEVAETGGHLRIFLDRQVLFPFREDTKEKIDNGTGPMPYRLAYCGPPMHAEMEQRSVQQFIAYHRYAAGYDHLQLYDATAVTPALTAALQPLMDDGLLTIADFRQAYQFDSWYFSQAVAMHDCMYGMRQRADWIAFHDLDEYLALPPPASVPALLQRYAALPYITLGMYVFSAHLCEEGPEDVWSDEEKRFAVERMVQRRATPYCLRAEDDPKLCIDYYGHRKTFLNPRKVEAVYVHLVDKPATGGVDLSVDEMYFAHLRSLTGKAVACRPPTDKENDLPPAELERCTTVAETAARARECAQEGFSNQVGRWAGPRGRWVRSMMGLRASPTTAAIACPVRGWCVCCTTHAPHSPMFSSAVPVQAQSHTLAASPHACHLLRLPPCSSNLPCPPRSKGKGHASSNALAVP